MRTRTTSTMLLAPLVLLSTGLQAGDIGFILNKGQVHDQFNKPNPAVEFLLNTPGLNVQLRADGFSYDTYVMQEAETHGNEDKEAATTYRYHRIDLRFMNANPGIQLVAEGESQDYLNYYSAVTGDAGSTFIRHYTTVTYKDVWPGIDVRCNATEDGFKYDVIVRLGGRLDDVRFKVEGATIHESMKGRLVFDWSDGSLEEMIPESWVETARRRSRAEVRYTIHPDGSFGFRVDEYMPGTLVIDPSPIIWATYYGGSSWEVGSATGVDQNNNAYLTGETESSTSIATAGAFSVTYVGYDADFLVQFTDAGIRTWGTYFTGGQVEDMDVSPSGTIAIVGLTSAEAGVATPGTHQSTPGDNTNGFIQVFNAAGQRMWGSYYWGTGTSSGINHDGLFGVAVASNGNIAVCGYTGAPNGITTPGTQTPVGAGSFLALLNSSGQRLWCTWVATGTPWASSVVFSGTSSVFVAGWTSGSPHIASGAAIHDASYNGQNDGFIMKYNTSTGLRSWGTFFGGYGADNITGIAYAGLNRIAVCGTTTSTSGIASSGAHQSNYNGGASDGFVAMFNTITGARVWGSYFGEPQEEQVTDIDGTDNGHVVITGTQKGNFTPEKYTFCADFDNLGTLFLTVDLCEHNSESHNPRTAANPNGMMVSGTTESATNVSTPSAHQTSLSGTQDAFLYHLHYALVPTRMAVQEEHTPPTCLRVTVEGGVLRMGLGGCNGAVPAHLTILDVQGRTVDQGRPTAPGSWPIDQLSPGSYLVAIDFEDGSRQVSRILVP